MGDNRESRAQALDLDDLSLLEDLEDGTIIPFSRNPKHQTNSDRGAIRKPTESTMLATDREDAASTSENFRPTNQIRRVYTRSVQISMQLMPKVSVCHARNIENGVDQKLKPYTQVLVARQG